MHTYIGDYTPGTGFPELHFR